MCVCVLDSARAELSPRIHFSRNPFLWHFAGAVALAAAYAHCNCCKVNPQKSRGRRGRCEVLFFRSKRAVPLSFSSGESQFPTAVFRNCTKGAKCRSNQHTELQCPSSTHVVLRTHTHTEMLQPCRQILQHTHTRTRLALSLDLLAILFFSFSNRCRKLNLPLPFQVKARATASSCSAKGEQRKWRLFLSL